MTAENHLLIDLGGTHTRVAWGQAQGIMPESMRTYHNRDFTSLENVLAAFLKDQPGQVAGLCAGVAGPVQGNTAQLTNYNWFIDSHGLKSSTGARDVFLINDLQAQGYALDDVPPTSIHIVKSGTPRDTTRAILNIGTGCNCAVVHRVADRLFVPAAESGHSALAHAQPPLRDLFGYLCKDHSHLPIEAVLSGPGLARVHNWVSGKMLSPEAVMEMIKSGTYDSQQTLSLFLRVLGATAGDLALHHLPKGGLYLSGGLGQAIGPYLDASDFLDAFTDKGPYKKIVSEMPIFVIKQNGFALHGCLRYLLQSL
ncbi:MAG: ROK family protein [Pseudomonadota bacterium]